MVVVNGLLRWMTMLSLLLVAGPAVGVAQTVAQEGAAVKTFSPRQRAWLDALPDERVRLAERLGEDGARAYAKAKGWTPLSDGSGKLLPQGPDQVYRTADGPVILVEAKGGSGQLSSAYGYRQGSAEWAVESAKRVLRSEKAGAAEKTAARAALEAAAEGKLEVRVIRTDHVLGEPIAAVLEQTTGTTEQATLLARAALVEAAPVAASANAVEVVAASRGSAVHGTVEAGEGVAAATEGTAVATEVGGKLLQTASKAALPAAMIVDGGLRVERSVAVERDFAAGRITQHQREVAHATNAGGFVGGWGGAVAGAEFGAGIGAFGGPIGAAIGSVIGGIGGYFGGEAAGAAVGAEAVKLIDGN